MENKATTLIKAVNKVSTEDYSTLTNFMFENELYVKVEDNEFVITDGEKINLNYSVAVLDETRYWGGDILILESVVKEWEVEDALLEGVTFEQFQASDDKRSLLEEDYYVVYTTEMDYIEALLEDNQIVLDLLQFDKEDLVDQLEEIAQEYDLYYKMTELLND